MRVALETPWRLSAAAPSLPSLLLMSLLLLVLVLPGPAAASAMIRIRIGPLPANSPIIVDPMSTELNLGTLVVLIANGVEAASSRVEVLEVVELVDNRTSPTPEPTPAPAPSPAPSPVPPTAGNSSNTTSSSASNDDGEDNGAGSSRARQRVQRRRVQQVLSAPGEVEHNVTFAFRARTPEEIVDGRPSAIELAIRFRRLVHYEFPRSNFDFFVAPLMVRDAWFPANLPPEDTAFLMTPAPPLPPALPDESGGSRDMSLAYGIVFGIVVLVVIVVIAVCLMKKLCGKEDTKGNRRQYGSRL